MSNSNDPRPQFKLGDIVELLQPKSVRGAKAKIVTIHFGAYTCELLVSTVSCSIGQKVNIGFKEVREWKEGVR